MGLTKAFPTAKVDADNVRMYVRLLADIPTDELAAAAAAIAADSTYFPSVRELRRRVVEARLGLPDMDTAWELAERYATATAMVSCETCEGLGVVPGGEPLLLDRTPLDAISDPTLKALLGRVADKAQEPTMLCPACDGDGQVPNPDRPTLDAATKRALGHVGGVYGLREADSLSVVRAQFLKAYERAREETVAAVSIEGAAAAQLPAAQKGIGR